MDHELVVIDEIARNAKDSLLAVFQHVKEELEQEKQRLKQNKESLDKERQVFDLEKQKMNEIMQKIDEIVYLNVGGKAFTTSRSTLTKYAPSVLEAMFSGRWKMVVDRENRIFIDRNGKIFERILEVLRDPRSILDVPLDQVPAFYRELEFFGLTPFFSIPTSHLYHQQLLLQQNNHYNTSPFHNNNNNNNNPSLLPLLPPKLKELAYSSDFDKNGVFYYLGTKSLTSSAWQNPCALGLILLTSSHINYATVGVSGVVSYDPCTVQASPAASGYGSVVTACGGGGSNAGNTEWFCIHFVSHALRPTCYTLRTRDNANTHHPRNWELHGSVDGDKWKVLSRHVNDINLNGVNSTFTWNLNGISIDFFRFFKLLQTGVNSSGARYFTIGGMEIYGTMLEL